MVKTLIVEDDLMIADCLEEILQEAGYQVCGIARTVSEAITIGRKERPDLAIIDLRLANGGYGTEVGAALWAQGRIGILYVSGNPDHPALVGAPGDGCIPKPYSPDVIIGRLAAISARVARTSEASPPPQH